MYIYMYTLPSPWTSLRAAATFRVTWSGYVTEIHWPRRLGKTPYGDRANVQQCCQNRKALLQRLTRVSPQPSHQGLLVFRTWFRGSANKTKTDGYKLGWFYLTTEMDSWPLLNITRWLHCFLLLLETVWQGLSKLTLTSRWYLFYWYKALSQNEL